MEIIPLGLTRISKGNIMIIIANMLFLISLIGFGLAIELMVKHKKFALKQRQETVDCLIRIFN